jgi:DNA-binding transcriptional LysR family regulator
MDTKHLVTFITFAEEKTYLKTSMKLNYAPSTLAEHIGALEQELGVKLVESRGKHTILTKAGELFLPYARQIMQQYKTSCQVMASSNQIRGNLRVLAVESLALHTLSKVFAKFSSQYPDVHLSVSTANCDSMLEKLESDQADVAFFYDMEPICSSKFDTTVLFKQELVFVVSPHHKLAKKSVIIPADFKLQTFILAQKDSYYSKAFNKMLEENHVTIQKRLELDSGNLIKECVKTGNGIAILPRNVICEELEKKELICLNWKGPKWEIYAQAISQKINWPLPGVLKLINTAQDIIKNDQSIYYVPASIVL